MDHEILQVCSPGQANNGSIFLSQVLGNAKGVVAAVISVLIFRNPVTFQGGMGYATTLAGVIVYSYVSDMTSPLNTFLFFKRLCHYHLTFRVLQASTTGKNSKL